MQGHNSENPHTDQTEIKTIPQTFTRNPNFTADEPQPKNGTMHRKAFRNKIHPRTRLDEPININKIVKKNHNKPHDEV